MKTSDLTLLYIVIHTVSTWKVSRARKVSCLERAFGVRQSLAEALPLLDTDPGWAPNSGANCLRALGTFLYLFLLKRFGRSREAKMAMCVVHGRQWVHPAWFPDSRYLGKSTGHRMEERLCLWASFYSFVIWMLTARLFSDKFWLDLCLTEGSWGFSPAGVLCSLSMKSCFPW